MNMFEKRSIKDQIEILEVSMKHSFLTYSDTRQLLKQQLKSTRKLADILQKESDTKSSRPASSKYHESVRKAVETGCAHAIKSIAEDTGQQLDEINLKIKELKDKHKEVKIEPRSDGNTRFEEIFNKFCEDAMKPTAFDFGPKTDWPIPSFDFAGKHASVEDDNDEYMTGT